MNLKVEILNYFVLSITSKNDMDTIKDITYILAASSAALYLVLNFVQDIFYLTCHGKLNVTGLETWKMAK